MILVALALAELPPPDYRSARGRAAGAEVARLAREQGIAAAEAFARRWSDHVGPEAEVSYELGLALRVAGREDDALRALDTAIKLDPRFVAARYDRGEVYLNRGKLDAAEADFREVVALEPNAWPGHFRLADVAGRRGDVARFETHLLDALRHGWSARSVVGDPRWRSWVDDPALGPGLRRILMMYQGEAVIEELRGP